MRSVCPSVCGWNEVERRFLRSRDFESAVQNWEVKMDPRSETIESGMPWRRITSSKSICANSGAVVVFKQGTKWHIFVSLSTATNSESYPLDTGRSVTKSQDIPFHGPEGTGSGASSPCLGCRGDLPRAQSEHQ